MPRARVLAYLRVSGQEQGRSGTSLEAQREEIARWARANEHASPVFFSEIESGSAARTEARAELARLTSEARPGDVVVVCAVDRWSRDIVHAVASVRALVARGVRWLALREGIDATTRGGDSTLGIMSWAADQERQRIRDRTVGRRVDLKASGIYCEGAIPLGYQRAPGERRGRGLVLDEAGAAIVRQAFEACIAGASLAEIATKLPLPPGRARWTKTAINDLLRHRVYLGEVQAKPGVWIPAKHPAIIARESFDATARALAERRIGGRPGSAESRYVRVDDAERIAAEKIVERLIALRRVLAKRAPSAAASSPRTDRSAELAALAKRRSRVLDAYERGAPAPRPRRPRRGGHRPRQRRGPLRARQRSGRGLPGAALRLGEAARGSSARRRGRRPRSDARDPSRRANCAGIGTHPAPGVAMSTAKPEDPPDLPTAIVRRDAARQALADAERAVLLAALRQTGGNRTKAARLLGVPDRTIFRHVAALGADAPPPPATGTMTRAS